MTAVITYRCSKHSKTYTANKCVAEIATLLALAGVLMFAGPRPAAAQQKPKSGPAKTLGRRPSTGNGTTAGKTEARLLANLSDQRINESSGIARGDVTKGILWTHNDSGDGPFLFAINKKGETLARFEIAGAKNVDWEDIANGPGETGKPAIYVGDIGDNSKNRSDLFVYRIDEPAVDTTRTRVEATTELPDKYPFRYPDHPHDAETLLVHPTTGEIVIVTKEEDGVSGVYAFPIPLKPSIPVTLEKVGTIVFKSQYLTGISSRLAMGERMATGGSVSPDGRKIVIRTYLMGYEWKIAPGASIAQALKGTPRQIALPLVRQGESICYSTDGRSLFMTSEGVHPPLYELVNP